MGAWSHVRPRWHERTNQAGGVGTAGARVHALLAAFHTCSDESGSAGMSRVPELRVTWEQGVRLVVQGGYPFTQRAAGPRRARGVVVAGGRAGRRIGLAPLGGYLVHV